MFIIILILILSIFSRTSDLTSLPLVSEGSDEELSRHLRELEQENLRLSKSVAGMYFFLISFLINY